MLLAPRRPPVTLAARQDGRVVEGPTLLAHDGFYYLFNSFGRCCDPDLTRDDYRESVGRSRSLEGPFLGREGHPLLRGAGTVLLEGNGTWIAPGGATAWTDAKDGQSFLVFHALNAEQHGRATLHRKAITWKDGWPILDEQH